MLRKRNFYNRLIVSYLFLVIVIVGLIAASFYSVFRKIYIKNMDEVNQRILLYTADLYEEKIFQPVSDLYVDLLSASDMGRLGKSFFNEAQMDTMEIYRLHKYLQGKLTTNEYISEIHFYSEKKQEIISTRFGYKRGDSVNQLLENMHVCSMSDEAVFPIVTGIYSYTDDDSGMYYNMIYPSNMLGIRADQPKGYMIFTLDTNKIRTLINSGENSRIYIVEKDGEVLCAYDNALLGKRIPFPFDPNRDFSVSFENDVVISWVRSSVGDIFLGVENSMDGFYPAVRQMISRMFLITTVLLFFGFFIAFGMSAYVTQPIKQVTKQMSDMIRIKDKSTKKGLEEIADAICTEFHTLEEFIKRNREIIKNNYILNLYLNQCNRIKSLEEKKVYIDFKGSKHYIPALLLCPFQEKINEEARQMALYKYIYDLENNQYCQQIIAAEVDENIIAVIYNGTSKKDFKELLIKMLEELGDESSAYYGNSCINDGQIGEMFQNLKEMLPYRYFYPEKSIFPLEEFAISQDEMNINLSQFEKNLNALKIMDCLNEFKMVLQTMEKKKISYDNRQKVLVLFVSTVTNIAFSKGIRLESMNSLINSKDIGQFHEGFEYLLNEFKDIVQSRQNSKKQNEIDKIKNFIISHYDCDVSLSMIAEELNMNPSYVSRFFKEMTGQNITEYVKNIKLEEGKKLLLNTDYSVENIAQMVGYNTTHYFIKHFKGKYGCTPIVYRREKENDTI